VLKKIVVILGFALSPFVSLVLFTKITIVPAIILAHFFTKDKCANEYGESLCGMGEGMFIGLILNAVFGLGLIMYVVWKLKNSWLQKNKVNITFLLSIYFVLVTAFILYFSFIKPGYLN